MFSTNHSLKKKPLDPEKQNSGDSTYVNPKIDKLRQDMFQKISETQKQPVRSEKNFS